MSSVTVASRRLVAASVPNLCSEMTTTTITTITTPYKNDASKILPIRVDCSSKEQLDQQITRVVQELCPTLFQDTDSNHLCITKLSGGLSNALFAVKSHDSHEVLVRIQPNDGLVNLEQENGISAWLSSLNKAPLYYGRFENGRVEEFYSGYTPLDCRDMQRHQAQIASLLASLHASTPPVRVLPKPTNHMGYCWTGMQSWLNIARAQHQSLDIPCLNLDYLQQELGWLKRQLATTSSTHSQAVRYCRQVVFTHMDAQSLNLLKNGNEIKLIDYEYAAWNPRAADIANTFCEYCDMNRLKANYQTQYPSPQQQDEFIHAYLTAMQDTDLIPTRDYAVVRREIGKHSLISHLMWTVWSIVQHQSSEIEFDYLEYAQQRMRGYDYFKQHYYTVEEINS